jgi:hypothetical protein
MKKIWFLALLPSAVLLAGCSFIPEKTQPLTNNYPTLTTENNICSVPIVAVTTTTSANKNILPPVSQEEKKKTFTYEDEEMGVKMKYPGSCFFNKGVFQCSDFTLSVWLLDGATKPSAIPEKTFKDGQTQIKYTYINGNRIYALMAWYDGENKPDLEVVIDKIAKSLTFTR